MPESAPVSGDGVATAPPGRAGDESPGTYRRTEATIRIVIHLSEHGEPVEVVTDGPAEVYTVCDHIPGDRVYRLTTSHTVGVERVTAALGADPIGVLDDAERGRLAARPRPTLRVVEPD